MNPPYPPLSNFQHPPLPSLGLGYLAAVLEKNQYEVDLIDCLTPRSLTFEEFRNEIRKRQPAIVAITSTVLTYKSALKIAEIAKKVWAKCLTVIGGPHVTYWDENALQECAFLDVVVRGEGENTMLELAERIEAGKDYCDVLGTTCRKDGKIVKNSNRAYIENLDDIPFPARHLWPIETFQRYGKIIFQLYASRGCVYWCDFCIEVRMHGRKYRVRSARNVVDEIEFLYKTYGGKNVLYAFCDAAFTVDQARTEEICEQIRNRHLKIKWICGTRIDMVTKELLVKMKAAGCISVWYGVESGTQPVLDAMRKGISPAKTIRTFKWTREAGLRPEPNIVIGFPGETKESDWKTIKFVERISPDLLSSFTIATPYPGTPLYDLVKKNGWLKVTDFDKYDTATPTFETPTLSMKELSKILFEARRSFYLRPTYILRMFAKGGMHGLSATKTAFDYILMTIISKLSRSNKS